MPDCSLWQVYTRYILPKYLLLGGSQTQVRTFTGVVLVDITEIRPTFTTISCNESKTRDYVAFYYD